MIYREVESEGASGGVGIAEFFRDVFLPSALKCTSFPVQTSQSVVFFVLPVFVGFGMG